MLGSPSALAEDWVVPSPSPRALVVSLYREFAWSSLFAPDPALRGPHWQGVSQQSAEVLGRYFEPQLARLLVYDQECAARTQGICNLDFDPIFNAQDEAGASDLTVSSGAQEKVTVSIGYPSDPNPMKLVYTVKHAPAGWRIFDIEYPSGPSLRTLLSRE
jgi:hypothetical protein